MSGDQISSPLGVGGEWGRRLILHYIPIALASGLVLLAFMTLPPFDPQAYPQLNMGGEAALPRPVGEDSALDHDGGQRESRGHDGYQAGSGQHGEDHAGAEAHVEEGAGRTQGRRARDLDQRLTRATGYVATGLLALTLLIGPAHLLLGKRNPVSSYLRRDLGVWTAFVGLVHVFFGLQLHGGVQLSGFLDYFITADGNPRLNSFGLANWTGLAATVIVVGLLAISNNFALRQLKAGPWKWLQRLNYALFVLVVSHAFFYGALLRVTSPFTLLLVLSVFFVFAGQALGIWSTRRRHPPKGPAGVPQ